MIPVNSSILIYLEIFENLKGNAFLPMIKDYFSGSILQTLLYIKKKTRNFCKFSISLFFYKSLLQETWISNTLWMKVKEQKQNSILWVWTGLATINGIVQLFFKMQNSRNQCLKIQKVCLIFKDIFWTTIIY